MSEGLKIKGSRDLSEIWKKKQIARQRWQILAETLKGRSSTETQQSAVSVRRFHSFGLLKTERTDSIADGSEKATWYCYTCPTFSHLRISIRHVCETIRPEDLLGFNNTGNVCVWPAEEIMTYYCLQHAEDFRGCNIVELGGGMTCLAGVAISNDLKSKFLVDILIQGKTVSTYNSKTTLAASSSAQQVLLTDGNEQSVSNLHNIIQENNFGETSVSARLFRWGPEPVDADIQQTFDWVLCADCLFFDEGREHLVHTIFSLLKPGGQALVFAPSRNGTFEAFCDIAKTKFAQVVIRRDQYDSYVQNLHLQLKESSETYTEDLHLPLLVELTKQCGQSADSRDTTPESR